MGLGSLVLNVKTVTQVFENSTPGNFNTRTNNESAKY